ncbi:MAG: hypothetical protein KGH75_13880 [Rhodospirillales bacterium]|nr:hypothetical protein [Rhodospirillales bacterium]
MPWEESDVVKHNKDAAKNKKKKTLWVKIANKVLKKTGNEGRAIREANSVVNKIHASEITHYNRVNVPKIRDNLESKPMHAVPQVVDYEGREEPLTKNEAINEELNESPFLTPRINYSSNMGLQLEPRRANNAWDSGNNSRMLASTQGNENMSDWDNKINSLVTAVKKKPSKSESTNSIEKKMHHQKMHKYHTKESEHHNKHIKRFEAIIPKLPESVIADTGYRQALISHQAHKLYHDMMSKHHSKAGSLVVASGRESIIEKHYRLHNHHFNQAKAHKPGSEGYLEHLLAAEHHHRAEAALLQGRKDAHELSKNAMRMSKNIEDKVPA